MNHKITRLKNYVSDKASFLKTFELLDEEDLEKFLPESKPLTGKIVLLIELGFLVSAALDALETLLFRFIPMYLYRIITTFRWFLCYKM